MEKSQIEKLFATHTFDDIVEEYSKEQLIVMNKKVCGIAPLSKATKRQIVAEINAYFRSDSRGRAYRDLGV